MPDLQYNDLSDYTEIPAVYIAEAGASFVGRQIKLVRSKIYNHLRRRYDVGAMKISEPDVVKAWIGAVMAPKVMRKKGIDPTDLVYLTLVGEAKEAWLDVELASNSRDGLYDLPTSDADQSAAKTKMKVLSRSDADPSAFKRKQAERARVERCENVLGINGNGDYDR